MLRPSINTHKNINLTDSGGIWRRVWGLMEKDGTYIVAVSWLVEENGTYGVSGVVWCRLICFFIEGVKWVMCMGQSVREGVCSRAYILKGFLY